MFQDLKQPKALRGSSGGTTIQSLARGLRILEAVATEAGGTPLGKICRACGLHRSTTHHLLQTLVVHGYVTQDEATRSYRLGQKVFSLASKTWSEIQIAGIARPYLHELVRKTGETTDLAVRKNDHAILLETVDGEGTLRVVDRVGAVRPIYCSAVGKVLLAWASTDEREVIVQALKFKAYTPRTIRDRGRLTKELVRVRQQGYAFDDEEMARGVRCIAAPVFVFPGQVAAAIGIAGPAARISRQVLERLAKPLVITVRQLSSRLTPTWGASRGQ